jgi:hypothetical protein
MKISNQPAEQATAKPGGVSPWKYSKQDSEPAEAGDSGKALSALCVMNHDFKAIALPPAFAGSPILVD